MRCQPVSWLTAAAHLRARSESADAPARADRPASLGNEFDQVGRYFMEHLHVPLGHMLAAPGAGNKGRTKSSVDLPRITGSIPVRPTKKIELHQAVTRNSGNLKILGAKRHFAPYAPPRAAPPLSRRAIEGKPYAALR
jgi:hypothetical protein